MSEPESKRKKPNYYIFKRKQLVLEPGLKGFLCTCNFREKECVHECYNLLNTYYSDSSTNEEATKNVSDKSSDSEDIADELSKEISSMKKEKVSQKRFQVVDSGAKNVVFIRTTVENPVELVCKIIDDIVSTKQQKTRFLLRLIPIEITCKANLDDIKNAASGLIDKYFAGEARSFAICFNHRNNHQINRDETIKEIANIVKEKYPGYIVDLKNAHYTVLVEIIRGVCLLSVVPSYMKYKKYNLLQLAESLTKDSKSVEKLSEVVENKE